MYSVYDSVDSSRDGFINIMEFFKLVNLPSDVFTHRLYRLFDRNNNGDIDFGEFMVSCWLFLPLTKHALLTFAFELFDLNGSKYISAQTIQEIIKELSSDPTFDINLLSELDMDSITPTKASGNNKLTKLNEDHFAQFALLNPCILYPALCTLEKLREKLGGTEFWENVTVERMGAAGSSDYLTFVVDIKRKTLRDNGLGAAFSLIRGGNVPAQSTASKKSVQLLKDQNNQRFGINSNNSSFRTISLLRQASSLILNNINRKKNTNEKTSGTNITKRKLDSGGGGNGKGKKSSSTVRPVPGMGRR